MDLEELERRWQAHDRTLERVLSLNTKVVRALGGGQARTALERLARVILVELAVDAVAVLWLGSRVGDRLGQPRFGLPALALLLTAVTLVADHARQLVRVRAIAVAADRAIVDMQRQLDRLRLQRARAARFILLASPLLWTPLLIVGLDALGVDAYRALGARYLLANVAFGLAAIPLGLWLANVYSGKALRSPALRSFVRDLSGRSLAAAEAAIGRLATFERDSTD
jgi:hypothetical protein